MFLVNICEGGSYGTLSKSIVSYRQNYERKSNFCLFWYIYVSHPAWLNEALCGKIDRQKYEPKSKFCKVLIFFLHLHHTKYNHDKHFFNENVKGKKCYGLLASLLTLRNTCKLQSWRAQLWSCFEWYHLWWCSTFHNFWYEYLRVKVLCVAFLCHLVIYMYAFFVNISKNFLYLPKKNSMW